MASNMAESCPTTGCGGLGRGRLRRSLARNPVVPNNRKHKQGVDK